MGRSGDAKVTWWKQPCVMNGTALVVYGRPVLVCLMYLIRVSECSKLGSTGGHYVLFLPHHFKMQYMVLARTADLSASSSRGNEGF